MSDIVSQVNNNLQEENKIIPINRKRPFIMLDAKIESMNLSDCAYRLYCRIIFRGRNSKRGFCESRATTLKETGISHEKRTKALKELEDLKMIRMEIKKGVADKIFLTLPSEWSTPTRRKIRTGLTRRKNPTGVAVKSGRGVAVKSGPELDPFELDPLNNVCEENTHTLLKNKKTKERRIDSQLSGMLGDFVKRYSKEKFIPFPVSQKNVDSILGKFPSISPQIFFDEFVAFQSAHNLAQLLDLNNITLDRVERAFCNLLAQKYGLEQKNEPPQIARDLEKQKKDDEERKYQEFLAKRELERAKTPSPSSGPISITERIKSWKDLSQY